MELQLRIKEKYQHKQRDESGWNVWKRQVKSSQLIRKVFLEGGCEICIFWVVCLSSSWKNIAWITRKISSSSKKRTNSFHENKGKKTNVTQQIRCWLLFTQLCDYSERKKNYEKKTGQTAWNGIKYYQIHWRPQQGSVFVDSVSLRATFI